MLTGTIDSGKRLLVKQAYQTMLAGHTLHGLHHHLVMINSNIDLSIDRCQLMLCRCTLIVLSLGTDAQTPQFLVQILHERADTRTDASEIMIIHLLAFCRLCTE